MTAPATPPLTLEEIAELRRLHETLPPAPWVLRRNRHPETTGEDWGWMDDGTSRGVATWTNRYGHVSAEAMGHLAAARNALPRLLLAAERAEEMARALEEIAAMECSFGGFCDDKGHFGQPPDPLCAVCRARRARAAWRGSGAAEDGEGTP